MLDPRSFKADLSALRVQRESAVPVHRQIYAQVRDLILAGTLTPGMRLHSTRGLAEQLGVARNTVLLAFEQLYAEGFLESGERSSITVARDLPTGLMTATASPTAPPAAAFRRSALGAALLAHERTDWQALSEFSSGLPDHASFPYEVWTRLFRRVWGHPPSALIRDRDPMGYLPLRVALSAHLRATRGLQCGPERILVTSGTANSLDLIARLFLDRDDAVWIEEPGFLEARFVLMAAGARMVPVPVDAEGIVVQAGRARAETARMAVVSPSHQFPLGSAMSLQRRLELLEWATAQDAWILEDDYDSEFRYAGPSVAALQALDRTGRVFYLGTFSKSLLPNLRLSYVVLPAAVAEYVAAGRARLDSHSSFLAQPVLAAFIEEGHLATHLRRMRRLYASRQQALRRAIARHFAGFLTLGDDVIGIHLIARFSEAMCARMTDAEASRRAAAAGIGVNPLSRYYVEGPAQHGLVFGYAGMAETAIERRVAELATVLLGADAATDSAARRRPLAGS